MPIDIPGKYFIFGLEVNVTDPEALIAYARQVYSSHDPHITSGDDDKEYEMTAEEVVDGVPSALAEIVSDAINRAAGVEEEGTVCDVESHPLPALHTKARVGGS